MKITRAALLLTGAFVIGCQSDSTVGPSNNRPADLNAALKAFNFSAFSALVPGGDISTTASPATSSDGCAYTAQSQSFICATVSGTGFTAAQSFTLLDASGAPQSKWGDNIAAIRMKALASGTNSGQSFDAQTDLTLSGLITGVHMLDGTATSRTVSGTGSSQTTVNAATTLTGLVLPNSTDGANALPKAGTINAAVSTTTGGSTQTAQVQMTFNGTSKVAMVVTVNGLTIRCTVDVTASNPTCS